MSKSKAAKKEKLFQLALEIRNNAHAPYSNFQVGAALLTPEGQIFTGCNVENASYGGTICAERVAVLKAVSEGFAKFSEIVVVARSKKLVPPCALCLQTLAEFCDDDFVIHLADLKGIQKSFTLKQLLPYPFNAKFL